MGDTDSTGTSSTVSDAASAQFKTAAPEMRGYANEKDPSWEDVVAMVVIPGNPNAIYQAAGDWRTLLSRVAEVERVLKEVLHDLEDWKGAGGEEYRSHLTDMHDKVKQITDTYADLPHLLDRAGNDVRDAIASIPIPADMIHEVDAAKSAYLANGKVTGPFFPGSFYQKLLPIYKNKWLDGLIETQPLLNWASHKLRDWISDNDDKAKDAYGKLAGYHLTTMDDIKGGDPSTFRQPHDPSKDFDPTKLGGPGANLPKGGNPPLPNTTLPDTSNPSLNNPDLNNPNLTDPSTGNPITGDDLPGTGLAGAGGGLSGGGGLGTGGLGPASGVGPGGLGAGGLGSGLGAGGLRGSGGLGGMMPGVGLGGMGAGAGAGKGGARAAAKGLGAGRGGVAGMGGHGGHGAGEDEDHSTWLEEDEDVWGSDSEAPPSVLG